MWMPVNQNTNTGDDIAGTVHSVGTSVTEFKPGDRVAAFHEMRTPGGSFAEYAIAEEHATFHLPPNISFEEGATIPLAAMTAAIGTFVRLGLPEPWVRDEKIRARHRGGVVVYGAASAVGGYVIKFLTKSDIHPIICVAGRGKEFVEGLIDREKGDVIIDYREGDQKVIQGIKDSIVKGEKLNFAFDAVSDHNSYQNICEVLERDGNGYLTVVLPGKKYDVPEGVILNQTAVGTAHGENREFAHAWYRLISLGLKAGWFKGHPYEVVPGGLGGVKQALDNLRDGKASAVKYVFRIDETEGVQGKSVA